jgi:hypothetical protein
LPPSSRPATLRRGDDVSKHDVQRPQPKRGGGRPRIDWAAAFAFFASSPTISFEEVGRQFGVSGVAVGKHAKAEQWNDRRAQLHGAVAARLIEEGVLKPLDARNRDTLLLIQQARTELRNGKGGDPKWSDLAPLVKIEQLLEGNATDRIDVRRVSAVIVAFIPRIASLVPRDRASELTVVLDEFEGELAALEAGGESA